MEATTFKDKTYLPIKSDADEIMLDFRNTTRVLASEDGSLLGSGVFGVRADENHIQNVQGWMAILAYIFSLGIIALHCIYIGNYLLYKVDNILILAQSLYFFSFINLMVGNPVSQYYYGFLWSHFGFFPNYFAGAIPPMYL